MVMRTSLWSLLCLAACNSESGFSAQTQVDAFSQAPNNQVDILWVIDDSSSMAAEQQLLADGIDVFMADIDASGTDFHLGVTSTSFETTGGALVTSAPGQPAYLTNADANYKTEFQARALLGTAGSDKEKGIAAGNFALQPSMVGPGGPNEGFLRPDAQLLLVYVSDEEDCSDNGALAGEPQDACYTRLDELPPVANFASQLWNLKQERSLVNVGAIIVTDVGNCDDSNVWASERYAEMVRLNGGFIGDLCEANWDNMLGTLGLTAIGIRTTFKLTKGAVVGSIGVFVDDVTVQEDPTNGWSYDPDTWYIEFHGDAVPERGAEISVSYTVDPGAPDPVDQAATATTI